MKAIITLGKLILNIIYAFHKLRPARRRITFVSRQSNEPSIDIILLREELGRRYPDVEVKVLCRMIGSGIRGKIAYILYMCGPMMKGFASSQVVVLDGYCIAASILHHKKNLKIIQMWHAMGCFKKFGYAVIGMDEGYSQKIAEAMNMHAGYDAVLISGEHCRKSMSTAFGCSPSLLQVMPLPRTDFVRKKKYTVPTAHRIFQKYPELRNKKNILYTPTFRKAGDNITPILSLIECMDYEHYNLIIKPHPLMTEVIPSKYAIVDHAFSSLELEAALASCPVYLFIPDEENYQRARGFFDDVTVESHGFRSGNPTEIMEAIKGNRTKIDDMQRFAEKYTDINEDCTGTIAQYLVNCFTK